VCVSIEGRKKYFTIQTAPNDIAPHAIRTFMNMVDMKSWDDTMLYHQVDHVVVGVPVNANAERKINSELQQTLFSEYNEKFPHEELTIGFQRGGPEFYINMDDNSKIHGPGGQGNDDLNQGDSCFGKIVHGQDIIKDFTALNQKAMSTGKVYYTRILSMSRVIV
jgi:cyclophilin family peptidyl-prolyl cis-trans isomerase